MSFKLCPAQANGKDEAVGAPVPSSCLKTIPLPPLSLPFSCVFRPSLSFPQGANQCGASKQPRGKNRTSDCEMAEAMSWPYCRCCIERRLWFTHCGEMGRSCWFLSLGVKWKSLGLLWCVLLSVVLHCCTPRIWGNFFPFLYSLMGVW